jgi:hypothetical protein
MDEDRVLIGYDTGISDIETLVRETDLLGVQHIDLHVTHFGTHKPDEDRILEVAEVCRAKGWTFVLNVEFSSLGWDLSSSTIADVRKTGLCKGVLLDECDWQQINTHWVLPQTDYYQYKEKHYFVETEGLSVQTAYEAILAEATRRNQYYLSAGMPRLASEHLYPVMMHVLARAGFAICPKVLKETWGPVMLAVALGAAKQYDTDMWVDVDEWWHPERFGHPMKRYQSALRLAYWMGASIIHTEGGRLCVPGYRGLERTPHGDNLRQFAKTYVPEHPRPYTFRDVRPTTAIIRFDDTCFDIRQRSLGEYPGPMYGHIPVGDANTEWLYIWNILSHGYLRTDSITHNWETKLPIARSLFAPLNNVVVYDHLADDKDLAGIDWIFITGIEIPEQTFAAVERRVQAGATCVSPMRFLPPAAQAQCQDMVTIIPDGSGKWVVPKDFYWLHYETWTRGCRDPKLRNALDGLLGPEDCLQYTFGEQQLHVRMLDGDPDLLEYGLVPA